MRGLNRTLLTKLIHQEVDMEIRQELRSLDVEVHFHSDKVIQVCSDFICRIRCCFFTSFEKFCEFIIFYLLIFSAMESSQSWKRMQLLKVLGWETPAVYHLLVGSGRYAKAIKKRYHRILIPKGRNFRFVNPTLQNSFNSKVFLPDYIFSITLDV